MDTVKLFQYFLHTSSGPQMGLMCAYDETDFVETIREDYPADILLAWREL